MNLYEKLGLFIIISFFGTTYPESWRGAEVLIAMFGSILFFSGRFIEEVIDAVRTV